MNLYFLGILAALVVFFAVGIGAGRMVKDTNDYYVSGRNAPTLLIVGSLIASFLSTGAFLGDTGEVYSGFFIGIVTVGVIQATGYIYGAGFFGRYIRRSEVTTLPEYFGRRFCSKHLRRLSAVILLVSVSAYLLSAIQGVATLMSSITGYDYRLCAVIVWLAFTAFTIYSGSPRRSSPCRFSSARAAAGSPASRRSPTATPCPASSPGPEIRTTSIRTA